MNELIKQLEKQAYTEVMHERGGTYMAFDIEKFVELIIAECCLKLLSMDEKTKGNHNYYKHAALEVKKHFGVKQ